MFLAYEKKLVRCYPKLIAVFLLTTVVLQLIKEHFSKEKRLEP